MSRSPSAYASRSLASSWVPESPRDEPTPLSYVLETSSPQRSSSHDKYVPSCENTPEYVSAISSSSALYSTPSHRSSAVGISPGTREALKTFYEHVYGADSKRCLVTGKTEPLIAAHVVQRASKAEQLSLYEYCLGCDWQTFHVDSRRNLVYLESSWHILFDAFKWLLLPDLCTLQEVERVVKSVLAARSNNSAPIQTFLSKWSMDLKTKYTFMPLPSLAREPISRRLLNSLETWHHYPHPFNTLPTLECHISPPLAAINAGPKIVGLNLDDVSLMYHGHERNEVQIATTERLTLLSKIWGLFTGAKDDAKLWGNKNRGSKRKRVQDDDDTERLSQRSGRSTRSVMKALAEGQSGEGSGTRKRDWEMMSESTMTLTGDALAHLGKRQKTVEIVREWAKSTSGIV